MQSKERLADLRLEIDETDEALVALFTKRMEIARRVAEVKRENNLTIMDEGREQQVVDRARETAGAPFAGEAAMLMRTVMGLSRAYQRKLLFGAELPLLPAAVAPRSGAIRCAYQGVQGAWSEQAAAELYPEAERIAVDYFADVFVAVKEDRADYGVVPIENSHTGAIGETYDLLRAHGCYVVGRVRVPIRQCLVAKPGTKLEDVRQVLSHPSALGQCGVFLREHRWTQTACRNTAFAAQTVAYSAKDSGMAAIASAHAASLHGLVVLREGIEDDRDNHTDFVVIAREPEYDESCDMLTITFSTRHRSGALCEALLPYMAENMNLLRIESRPAADDQYRFFADLRGNILEESTAAALRQAASASEYFEVLGCYRAKMPEDMLR